LAALLLLVASAAIVFRLGVRSLQGWDEAIYAEVAREMLRSGDWLTLHYNWQPWFEKPPLMMWITASFFSIFGVSTFWARAASACAGIMLVLVTYLSGRKAFGTAVGALAGAILLSNYAFLWQARDGKTDVLLTLFIYLCILAYQHARTDRRYWYAVGVFFALAFMTKSWAALVIPPVLLVALVIDGTVKATLRSPTFWGALGLAVVLVVPWHAAMLVLHPSAFIDRYFLYDLVERSTTNVGVLSSTPRTHLAIIASWFTPWAAMVPFALAVNLHQLMAQRRRPSEPLYLIVACVVFGLYSLARTRYVQYIFPIYPGLCVLIALMIVKAFRSHRELAFSGLVLSLLLALLSASWRAIEFLLLAPAAVGAAVLGLSWIAESRASRSVAELRELSAEPVPSWQGMLLNLWESFRRAPLRTLGFRAFVVVVTFFFAGRSISHAMLAYSGEFSPLATLAQRAGQLDPQTDLLAMYTPDGGDANVDIPQLVFYSDRRVIAIENRNQLGAQLGDQRPQPIVLHQSAMQALSADYHFNIVAEEPPWVYASIARFPSGQR